VAISLISPGEKILLNRIAKQYNIPFEERPIPSDADVAAVVAERTTALLEARLRGRDKLQTERSHRFTPLARSLAENEDELPIITMLLDDYYQQTLHSPVSQPSGEPASKPAAAGRERRSRERSRRRR
jgi:ATP-dependent RNA helicase DeaD